MMWVSRITVISSDGHVAARMGDYRPYLEARFRPDFDDFLAEYAEHGVATTDATNVADRLDPEVGRAWEDDGADAGGVAEPRGGQRRAGQRGVPGLQPVAGRFPVGGPGAVAGDGGDQLP